MVYFGGFFAKLEFSRGFLYVFIIYFAGRISAAVHDGRGHYIFRVPRSSLRVRRISVVYSVAQKGAA